MTAPEKDENYQLLLESFRNAMYIVGNSFGEEVDRKLNVVIKLPGDDEKHIFREVDRINVDEGYGITYETISSEEEYRKLIADLLDKLSADGNYAVEFDWLFDVFIQESFRDEIKHKLVIPAHAGISILLRRLLHSQE